MSARADIERAILEEEAMLGQIAGLLEQGTELARWPEAARAALALALGDPAMSRTESWKAVALRRHLFGPAGVLPAQISATSEPSRPERKSAERLRSALPALVRYRAAAHLS